MIKEGKPAPKTSGGGTGVVVVCWVTLVFDVVDTVLETVLEDVVEVVWLIG